LTVRTPNGVSLGGKNVWGTGSAFQGYNTAEGAVLAQNGNDPLDFGSSSGDIELYIEVSDYWGSAPATGVWTFQLVPANATSVCSGTFHAWHGTSENIVAGWQAEPTRSPTPLYGGRPTDNKITIGSPATGNKVIAVAAYDNRLSWPFAYGVGTECAPDSAPTEQTYGVYPIHYYDPSEPGELAFFSARGPRRDNVLKPEIATPGMGIASSLSHFVRQDEWSTRCVSYWDGGPYHYGTNRVLPGDETTVLQGTSMASPNAAGAAALFLQQKRDLQDTCLRKVLTTTARHDAATDVFANTPHTAQTDTDAAAGAGKPNNDWGYGKMDIDATLAALAAYPACASSCNVAADCGTGYTCSVSADPCGCNACVAAPACTPAGRSCTQSSECCSPLSCSGKVGKKTCR
jgi:subtilisin family serine protease